jgi:5-methyltetrahydrofolate--homocysteine methyltransferase
MRALKGKLGKEIIILDGATGTNLLEKGLQPGETPSVLNLRNPEAVYALQRAYIDAGSDIILTNTFSANPFTMPSSALARALRAGAEIAIRAAGTRTRVWGDVGPLGELVQPYGELSLERARRMFTTVVGTLYEAGIRTFLLETFTSLIELKAAFLSAREISRDVFVCISLQDNGRTLMGDTPESAAVLFESLGARAIGINCTLPDAALPAVRHIAKVSSLPIIVKPNAGHVHKDGTTLHHTLDDAGVAKFYRKYVNAGASIVGGCCGTTPALIRMLCKKKLKPHSRNVSAGFRLTTPQKIVRVKSTDTFIVGERLNPSGRKKVKKRLAANDFFVYAEEARLQESAGADMLDVNAFVVDLNEQDTLFKAVSAVLNAAPGMPIFVDTQDFRAAEQILEFYPGIGIYNSIPARKKELAKWLPMVKKYGFKAVISLVGEKIPRTVKERMNNVKLALRVAARVNFNKDDLIFDPLVFSAATENEQIKATLETARILHKQSYKTVLGISNVSFGLPGRSLMNALCAAEAVKSGVTFLIMNPCDSTVMGAVKASRAFFFSETGPFVKFARVLKAQRTVPEEILSAPPLTAQSGLVDAIVHGDERSSIHHVQELLDKGVSAQTIIDDHISKALEQVGTLYERGIYFVPDLLNAADASKRALDLVKQRLPKAKKRGKVVLATVKGDIHDIGKNIAAMIFESAGFEVIDLGKDVSSKAIANAVTKYKPDALGLSALLTTTMPEMEHVIATLKRKNLRVRVIIGGPNVSNTYAKKIGAYGAARNVMEGLDLLKRSM